MLESELFGHVKGAFTGADRDRKGLFRECQGGTILLDEIGETPLKMQAGLLRVLQERRVRPVGGNREEEIDVRLLFATNRDLSQLVAAGKFREDLYYRIHVVEVRVPALRERPEDIPQLVDHFLGLFAARYKREKNGLTKEALQRLAQYGWPGNVRQLENVLLNAWGAERRSRARRGGLRHSGRLGLGRARRGASRARRHSARCDDQAQLGRRVGAPPGGARTDLGGAPREQLEPREGR